MTNYELIRSLAFGDYLEIGVQEGGSIEAALSSGRVTHATGIDTWGFEYGGTGKGSSDHVFQRLQPFRERFTLLTGNSQVLLPLLKEAGEHFDVIYIDGDHSEEGALIDLENSLSILRPNGRLLLDDLDHPSHPYLRRVAVDFAEKHKLSISVVDAHFGIAILKR